MARKQCMNDYDKRDLVIKNEIRKTKCQYMGVNIQLVVDNIQLVNEVKLS